MALDGGYGTGSKAIAGGAARIGDRLALQDKETASSQVSSFGASGGRCSQMTENKGRRAGLRLRQIKGLGFLDLGLSSQRAARDLQEAVRGQKPELSPEVRSGPPVWEALPLSLPSDWPFILVLKS